MINSLKALKAVLAWFLVLVRDYVNKVDLVYTKRFDVF